MSNSLIHSPGQDYENARIEQATERLLALLNRLSNDWTWIDTAQSDQLDNVALYLLCGAGIVELRLAGRAWSTESAIDFEANACGVWIDADRQSILPDEIRRAMPAWGRCNVVAQPNPVLDARLTFHGEETKRECLSDGAELFLLNVYMNPIRGRVTVRIIGNEGPAPGAVKHDAVHGETLAAIVESARRILASNTSIDQDTLVSDISPQGMTHDATPAAALSSQTSGEAESDQCDGVAADEQVRESRPRTRDNDMPKKIHDHLLRDIQNNRAAYVTLSDAAYRNDSTSEDVLQAKAKFHPREIAERFARNKDAFGERTSQSLYETIRKHQTYLDLIKTVRDGKLPINREALLASGNALADQAMENLQ